MCGRFAHRRVPRAIERFCGREQKLIDVQNDLETWRTRVIGVDNYFHGSYPMMRALREAASGGALSRWCDLMLV